MQLPGPRSDEGGLDESDETNADPNDELKTLVEIADDYPEPADFVAFVRTMQDLVEAARRDTAVVISTIHRLKGQERPYVFGIGWCQGVGRKPTVGLLPHTHSLRAAQDGDARAIENERCVAFVLISRAKVECRLSAPARYFDHTMRPSRFIWELGLKDEGED